MALLLDDLPVGVRICKDAKDQSHVGAVRPSTALFFCAAVARASRGEVFMLHLPDVSCDTATRILGLSPGFHDEDFLQSYVSCGLYDQRGVADTMLGGVPVLERTAGLIVAPVARFDAGTAPDVVIIGTTPHGAMRIVQAAAFHGLASRCDPVGMHGLCAECTAGPYSSGQVRVSLLCSSARFATSWGEERLAVGIPYGSLAEVVDGLLATMQRHEPDERKARIRAACNGSCAHVPALLQRVAELRDGEAYYAPPGPHRPTAG